MSAEPESPIRALVRILISAMSAELKSALKAVGGVFVCDLALGLYAFKWDKPEPPSGSAALSIFILLVYLFLCITLMQSKSFSLASLFRMVGVSVGAMIAMLLNYTILFRSVGIVSNGKASKEAADCLYFAAITWTTVGYGDCVPSAEGRLYAALTALTGYVFMAIFIAVLVHMFANLEPEKH